MRTLASCVTVGETHVLTKIPLARRSVHWKAFVSDVDSHEFSS